MRLLRVVFALAVTFGLVLVAGIAPRPALAAELVVGVDYSCDRNGLIEAIDAAGAEDIIRFSCDTATIDFSQEGHITIRKVISIDGSNGDSDQIILTGNGEADFFTVVEGGDLTLRHLTMKDGYHVTQGGAIFVGQQGRLTVDHTIFDSNQSLDRSGAIVSEGSATVRNSVFTGNHGNLYGGAIANYRNGTLAVSNSRFENNSAVVAGGAIANRSDASLTIVGSSFISNQTPGNGGAIFSDDGTLSVLASTFTGNRADDGSAIAVPDGATAHIAWSTIVQADGVGNLLRGSSSRLELEGVVLSGNAPDCRFTQVHLNDSYTLSDDRSCSLTGVGSQEDVSVELGPVSNTMVDGVMQTYYPLVEGSLAVDGGPQGCDTDIVPGVDTDQLGNPRPQHYFCDIGAIESSFASDVLCANQWNGQLSLTTYCDRGDSVIKLPLVAPLDLCVNRWNGSAHLGDDCGRSEYRLTLTGDSSTTACVNRWNGSLRISDRCSRSEREVSL